MDLGQIEAETSLDVAVIIEYSKDEEETEGRFVDYEFYVGFNEDKENDDLENLIYKRNDKVALKNSITTEDPIYVEDDDDSSGGHHSHGLNEEEKIAVGVTLSLVFLAVVGFLLWWIFIRGKPENPD